MPFTEIKLTASHSLTGDDLPRKKLVVDLNPMSEKNGHLETETVPFASQPPKFKNQHLDKYSENLNRLVDGVKKSCKSVDKVDHFSSMSDPLDNSLSEPGSCSSIVSSDGICENLEKQIRSQVLSQC